MPLHQCHKTNVLLNLDNLVFFALGVEWINKGYTVYEEGRLVHDDSFVMPAIPEWREEYEAREARKRQFEFEPKEELKDRKGKEQGARNLDCAISPQRGWKANQ